MPGGHAGHAAHLDLAALRDNPQIQGLREQVAQNPTLIQPLIQQLASQNPAMAQMIAQNPEALFQLLGVGGDEGEDGNPIPPGAHVVSVTEEERAAIQRVRACFTFASFQSHRLNSSKHLDFRDKQSSKLTLPVTKTKSWLLTIFSKADSMTSV